MTHIHRLKFCWPSLAFFCVICLATWLVGCAGLQPGSPHELAYELGFKAATARVLHERPTWKPVVADLSAEAEKYLSQELETTLGELDAFVAERIPWDRMLPEEEEAARLALKAIRQETVAYLERQGITDPTAQRLAVLRVVGWIHEVAARPG